MTQGRAIEELDLLAYADGLLDPARREEVEAQLRRDPEAAARVADYLAQNQAIRAAYGSVIAEPIPARLLAALERPPALPFWRRPIRLAAFAASLAMAGFLGWLVNEPRGGPAQPSNALVEASLALHADWSPRPEVAAGGVDGPLLLPKAFAAEEEGQPALRIPPPDLTPLGLRLLAVRATEGKGLPGVQLVYGDGQGERVSLFVVSAAGGPRPQVHHFAREGGEFAYWREGPLAFLLTGDRLGSTSSGVIGQVRGALHGAPLLVLPSPGMAAGNGGSAAGVLQDAPLPEDVSQPVQGEAQAM